MIVKCEQCQTRFKIPDDKVTDKGVKVRCTKCGNTFRVGKDGAAIPPGSSPSSVAAAAPPQTQTFPVAPAISPVSSPRATLPPRNIQLGGDDPFAPFGAPPSIPDDEATRPGVFVLGLEASKVPEIGAPPIPPQAPAKPPPPGAAFDFGSLAPPPPAAVPPAAPPRPAASTTQAARAVPRSSAPTASVPPVAPPPAAGPATTSPFDFSALMSSPPVPAAAPAPFDFSALSAPPPAPPSKPAAVPPPGPSTPAFDFSALGPLPEPAPLGPPPPAASTPAFDFSALGPPPPGPTANSDAATAQAPAFVPGQTARIPLGSQPGVPGPSARIPMGSQPGVAGPTAIPTGTQPGVGARFPTATQPAIPAPPPSAPPAPARPQSSAPLSLEADDAGPGTGDARTEQMPGLFGAPGAGADDFFGGALPEQPARPQLAPDVTGDAAKQALFDMAAALPAAPPDEPPAPEITTPAAAPAPAAPPAARPSAIADAAPRRRRTVLGIVVNVVIAAVLVVALVVVGSAYLNEGKVGAETLTWEHLKTTFAPSTDYVAGDISNGLYDTRAGRPVFFVRGEVMNRGPSATKLVVRAELVEGATVVRSAESTAGAPPSPEELFQLVTAEDVDALNAKVAQRAPVVEPGEAAAFIVTFFEYPPDLKGFRVRVSARPAGEPTARAP